MASVSPSRDLQHALEPALAQHPAEPARDDDGHLLAELLERGKVEVVVVRVRDEDGVDAAARSCRDRSRPPQVRDAVAQERIGQQAHAVEIDEDRRMTDVFDACHG